MVAGAVNDNRVRTELLAAGKTRWRKEQLERVNISAGLGNAASTIGDGRSRDRIVHDHYDCHGHGRRATRDGIVSVTRAREGQQDCGPCCSTHRRRLAADRARPHQRLPSDSLRTATRSSLERATPERCRRGRGGSSRPRSKTRTGRAHFGHRYRHETRQPADRIPVPDQGTSSRLGQGGRATRQQGRAASLEWPGPGLEQSWARRMRSHTRPAGIDRAQRRGWWFGASCGLTHRAATGRSAS